MLRHMTRRLAPTSAVVVLFLLGLTLVGLLGLVSVRFAVLRLRLVLRLLVLGAGLLAAGLLAAGLLAAGLLGTPLLDAEVLAQRGHDVAGLGGADRATRGDAAEVALGILLVTPRAREELLIQVAQLVR